MVTYSVSHGDDLWREAVDFSTFFGLGSPEKFVRIDGDWTDVDYRLRQCHEITLLFIQNY